MYVQTLSLRHFRTYARLELELPPAPVLLLGENAQGKTSLLEAIAYLAMGRSPLTTTERHLINWSAVEGGAPFAVVSADVAYRERRERIEIALQQTPTAGGERLGKRIRINGHPVRRADLAGHLNVVLFLPEDVRLVGGPPADRRRHLDDLLSQVSAEYVRALSRYRTALSRRNALLKHLRDEGGDTAQLLPLETALAEAGLFISLQRRACLHHLTRLADEYHRRITGGAWLRLHYRPSFDPLRPTEEAARQPPLFEALEDPPPREALLAAYRQRFEAMRTQEVTRGVTLIGPHRDEIRFIAEAVDLGTFGSRGQQRSAVLALHIAELAWLREMTGEAPLLLLDEVLAELDVARRHRLLDLIGSVEQTILATTDAEMFPAAFRRQALRLRVEGGIITPL